MSIIPDQLKGSKCHKAVSARNYYELKERHPKAFAIRTSRGMATGIVEYFEPDDYAVCPSVEIGKDEVAG